MGSSDLRAIVKVAHEHNMLVLADEAHGTHLYFGSDLPVCAMDAGADMASVSMHKSGGSLTQSSLLLTGKKCKLGICKSDYKSDTDNKCFLSADLQSGYFQEKSGTARTGVF